MNSDRDGVRVVLLSPRNPLNIGAAARAMSNFGFLHLRVVNAYDVAYREAKSAVNAASVLENSRQFASISDAIADCKLVVGTVSPGHRALGVPLRRLEFGGRLIREQAASEPVALLFGSEKFGMSKEEISYCHWLMHIPTREEHESMNLGQAVAVCLYELIRRDEAADRIPIEKASARSEDIQRITDRLVEVAGLSGYLNPVTAESSVQKIRHMVNRMKLNDQDAAMWLGMLRQMLWKLRKDGSEGGGG